jgi:hypothetical protein
MLYLLQTNMSTPGMPMQGKTITRHLTEKYALELPARFSDPRIAMHMVLLNVEYPAAISSYKLIEPAPGSGLHMICNSFDKQCVAKWKSFPSFYSRIAVQAKCLFDLKYQLNDIQPHFRKISAIERALRAHEKAWYDHRHPQGAPHHHKIRPPPSLLPQENGDDRSGLSSRSSASTARTEIMHAPLPYNHAHEFMQWFLPEH